MAKRKKHDDLDTVLAKIAKTKPPSRRQERSTTASNNRKPVERSTVKTHDVSAKPDAYLAGITARSEGRDPIKAIEALEGKPKSLAGRINRAVARRKAENHAAVQANEARIAAIREPKPLPDELPTLMAPKLRKRKPGEKPNVLALVYAFRAFQQFSYAHTRYSMGACEEAYYYGLKNRFHAYMKELGLAELYDWSEF